jgi:hypothetical protein
MLMWVETQSNGPPPTNVRRGRSFAFEWRRGRLNVGDAFPLPPRGTVEVALLPDQATVLAPARRSSRVRD